MNVLAGLLAFSLGLLLFVFPRGVTSEVAGFVGREAGHWETVAVRAVGILAMAFGFVALVVG